MYQAPDNICNFPRDDNSRPARKRTFVDHLLCASVDCQSISGRHIRDSWSLTRYHHRACPGSTLSPMREPTHTNSFALLLRHLTRSVSVVVEPSAKPQQQQPEFTNELIHAAMKISVCYADHLDSHLIPVRICRQYRIGHPRTSEV
jgi:hypothetical protein